MGSFSAILYGQHLVVLGADLSMSLGSLMGKFNFDQLVDHFSCFFSPAKASSSSTRAQQCAGTLRQTTINSYCHKHASIMLKFRGCTRVALMCAIDLVESPGFKHFV